MRSAYQRRKDLHLRNYDGGATGKFGHDHWVREQGCVVPRWQRWSRGMSVSPFCDGPDQAAHVTARGMGGHNGDWTDQVCMCARHHEQAGARPQMGRGKGSIREKFETLHGLDLEAIAVRLVDEHLAEHNLTRDDLVDGLVAA